MESRRGKRRLLKAAGSLEVRAAPLDRRDAHVGAAVDAAGIAAERARRALGVAGAAGHEAGRGRQIARGAGRSGRERLARNRRCPRGPPAPVPTATAGAAPAASAPHACTRNEREEGEQDENGRGSLHRLNLLGLPAGRSAGGLQERCRGGGVWGTRIRVRSTPAGDSSGGGWDAPG